MVITTRKILPKFSKPLEIDWGEIFNLQTAVVAIIFGLAISIVSLFPFILLPEEVTNISNGGIVVSIYKATILVSAGIFLLTAITYASGAYSQILVRSIWLFCLAKSLLLTGYKKWKTTQEPPKEELIQVDVIEPESDSKISEFEKSLLLGIWIVQPTSETEAFNFQLFPLPPTNLPNSLQI